MRNNQLLDEILGIIKTVSEDEKALEKIHTFLQKEIYKEQEEEPIPDHYTKIVAEMADSLIAGMVCFYNPDTNEYEDIPKDYAFSSEEFEEITGETFESSGIKHPSWSHCITIEPMDSDESFRLMERFIYEVPDNELQNKLVHILRNHKPFANFKWQIDNSQYRQQWFDFRQKEYENYVWETIKDKHM